MNNINLLIEKYKNIVDSIANINNYPDNIRELLKLIIPAFVIKYGYKEENKIINCFSDVIIKIDDKRDEVFQAYFYVYPLRERNTYKLSKGIVLQNYANTNLITLLDNLIHEYNHAVNSYKNDIFEDNDYIKVRVGLNYIYYNKNDFSVIKKDDNQILEEILNTYQTQEIINIILSFNNITNIISNNILNLLKNNAFYTSNSYYIQVNTAKELLNNRGFLNTLAVLRYNGEINDIYNWFDTVYGKKGSYEVVSKLLNESMALELELTKKKWFKQRLINKIRNKLLAIRNIIDKFNQNSNYK